MNVEEKYETKKLLFIQEFEKLLPFSNGLDERFLCEVDAKCGFEQGYHTVIFPDGTRQIVEYLNKYYDDLMLDYLKTTLAPKQVRSKIAIALERRITSIPKVIHTKMALYFLTPNAISLGTNCSWRTCDLIWRYAGDKSADFNHYTKRSLLMLVYIPAITFYLGDESENYQATKDFIGTAIENIIKIAKLKNKVKFPDMVDIPLIRLFS